MVAPTGFEPVFESRSRFRQVSYAVTDQPHPATSTRPKHAAESSLKHPEHDHVKREPGGPSPDERKLQNNFRTGAVEAAASRTQFWLRRVHEVRAPHDLDVFPRLRELLDQLPRLLTKSLVDRTQLTQVPVGFVALTHFVPKLRRDVAMAGLELTVGFTHLVELPFQTALGRPGFAEIPLTFFPLGAELLSLLLKLLHCVGHVDLDGEHIRFGHCADILHRSPLFLAG